MRKHARIDLERLEDRFVSDDQLLATIVDSGFASTVVIDLDCNVLQWSRAAEGLFGWRATEIIGRDVSLIVPADQRHELIDGLVCLGAGEEPAPVETVWHAKDGSPIYVRVQLTPFLDVAGRVVGAGVFSFDNSDGVRTRDALAASEARYRALVGALTEVVLVTDSNGCVALPQPSWSAFTGQDFEHTVEHGWMDALHPDERDSLRQQLHDGTELAEPFFIAGRIRAESGEYRHCEGRVAPMRDATGRVAEWVGAFSDVHERHLAEARERQAADRFRSIFSANVFGVCYGQDSRILDANDAMLDMLGARRTELGGGVDVAEFIATEGFDSSLNLLEVGTAREFELRRRDGKIGYVLASAVSLQPEAGWLAVAVDVTQRKAAERESEYRALHDPLTGLPNRRLLVDRLEHALTRATRQDTLVGLLFCDLDHFKEVNDAHGHAAGDAALETVARRLTELLREGDTVARTGGDEFVVVLEDLVESEDAGRIADRVRAELAEPVVFEDAELKVTCSIGVAISHGDVDRVEGLLNRADDAMYRAKEQGRDRIVVGAGGASTHDERRWVERELQRALAHDEFELAFQPVIDFRDGRSIGAEALLRWTVDGVQVPTMRAITVAEESGIITRISDWVLRAACREFAEWRAHEPAAAGWRLHVNVSARDLADERFVERMFAGIADGGCKPSDVCLEMTETAMLLHPERAHARLTALRGAGLIVAIDDFGTGYASLGVLRDVPADVVKIDQSFVAELNHSERARTIVRHSIELAHELDLVVVGEGVETLAQITILEDLGCDHAQGFAFARPQPISDLSVTI